jgi:iron complex outermembrane receptor protein
LMPRFSTSYLFNPQVSLRGIISKGYSLPTTAEVRASDARINPDLEPEEGWNYELGLRLRDRSERLYADISAFYYRMDNAIVKRANANDQEFFVNAGGTNQKGLELQLNAEMIKSSGSFIKNLVWNSATTLSDFKFRDYRIGTNDFSGNLLTGVPKLNLVNSLNFNFIKSTGLFIQHQFNGKTSLNDAETVFANSYHLVQLKLLWNKRFNKQTLGLQVGADNLLNEKYSLGNDINAFGNRYFNPSPTRNYFASVSVKW